MVINGGWRGSTTAAICRKKCSAFCFTPEEAQPSIRLPDALSLEPFRMFGGGIAFGFGPA